MLNVYTEAKRNLDKINSEYLDRLTKKYREQGPGPDSEPDEALTPERLADIELNSFELWMIKINDSKNAYLDEIDSPHEKYGRVADNLVRFRLLMMIYFSGTVHEFSLIFFYLAISLMIVLVAIVL
jgi:hypothetical protein